jgi:hypothetical protein
LRTVDVGRVHPVAHAVAAHRVGGVAHPARGVAVGVIGPAGVALVRAADGLSGAEIEGAIVEARLDAFAEQRPLAAADLARALASTVPLSRSRAAEIAALRTWASAAARRA